VLAHVASIKSSIRVSAYGFTSKRVAQALVDAKNRGVDVQVVVDYKENVTSDTYGTSKAALSMLLAVGIPVRTVSKFPIHHDKFMVGDGLTVQNGSFNYTNAATYSNSENVMVVSDAPTAAAYLTHWTSRWNMGIPYVPPTGVVHAVKKAIKKVLGQGQVSEQSSPKAS